LEDLERAGLIRLGTSEKRLVPVLLLERAPDEGA